MSGWNSWTYVYLEDGRKASLVAKPGAFDSRYGPDGCWLLVFREIPRTWQAEPVHCGCKARPGFLTCHHHAEYEPHARRLWDRIEQSKEATRWVLL